MAVAMESGWNASPSSSGFVGLLSSRKKRGWGEDQNKLLQLMIGPEPVDHDSSSSSAAAADSRRTTLDLLGSSSSCSSTGSELNHHHHHHHEPLDLKLDMEMPPPSGWEKRLDLKAGRFFYVNLSTGKTTQQHPTPSSVPEELESIPSSWDLQSELDRIGTNGSIGRNTEMLDLKLNLGGCSKSEAPKPKNISTIEAVQEALKRSSAVRSSPSSTSTSSSSAAAAAAATSSSSSSSRLRCHDQHYKQQNFNSDRNHYLRGVIKTTKRNEIVVDSAKLNKLPSSSSSSGGTQVLLTACKRCLMYVMLTSSDPRCPKCGSSVAADIPLQQQQQQQYQISKKPRLELNLL